MRGTYLEVAIDSPAFLGLMAGLAVTLVVLVAAIRTRRHKAHLTRLATKYSLGVLDGEVPARSLEKARLYRSSPRRVKLRDVLVGHDDEGRFHLAQRRIGRVRHQLLFFEVESTAHLEGFHVFPTRGPSRESAGPRSKANDWHLCLQWEAARRHWTDERALAMGARVLYHTASLGEKPGALMLGVEIHDRLVFIHSRRSLVGKDLDRFFADALRLRQLLLVSLQRANAAGQPGPARDGKRLRTPTSTALAKPTPLARIRS